MPNKVDESRRNKISKVRYHVKNWRDCDAALHQRSNLMVWVIPAAIAA